ncbi:hypothetical protein LWI29_032482 [Acer saccharum]|uniref:F-box domain-containing protein n=1 Tax=Acer saccharum TaxID=4024 RepID=A0AA39T6Z1_ACESA|nr:hypothetical protein LWI29_032482 [Acer saccharum]
MMSTKLPEKRKRIDSTPPPRGDDDDLVRWSDLPKDILLIIFRKLEDHNYNMIYRCGCVCVSWQSVVRASLLPQYLLLSNVGMFKDQESVFQYMHYHQREDYFKNIKSCVLFDLFTKRIREISLPGELLKGRWFTSSSSGWLLTIGIESPHEIHLVNPFCPEQKIELPNATKIGLLSSHHSNKWRVITSTNPLDPNCIFVAVIHMDAIFPNLILAFCRRGDKYWTTIQNLRQFCCDAIFYKDYFYTIDSFGQFLAIHVKFLVPPVTYIGWPGLKSHMHCLSRMEREPYGGRSYLVEFDGNLLRVIRRTLEFSKGLEKTILQSKMTVDFEVYKWNPTKKKWSEMIGIGNNVILLGKCSSISIPVRPSPSSPPDHGGVVDCMRCGELKANCIYFINDVSNYTSCSPQHEAGVYNMTNHRIDWFPESWPIWTSPLNWLRPML